MRFRRVMSPLNEEECRELLRANRSARLALTRRALPVIEPVEYGVVDDDVVIRTASGTWFGDALPGAVVALEADVWDDGQGAGWTVLVQGEVTPVDDPVELEMFRALDLDVWTDQGGRDCFVRIHPRSVSGYRMSRVALDGGRISAET